MEKITFGKDALPGYICGEKKAPGLIVIQEWWGVTDIIKNQALQLSEQGYRCLVPDIYHGKIGVDKEEALHLMDTLDWPRAVEELSQAVQFLKEEGSEKVGAIGFCMGGALAVAACQHCGIDCAAPFYGTPSKELSQPENIKVPVEFHSGELDDGKGFSDPATVGGWADEINKAGGSAASYLYENCGHAFINAGEHAVELRKMMDFPEPSTAVQDLAWSRVHAFFEKHLKS